MGSGRGIMAVRQHAMPDGELATGPYAAAFQTRLPWLNLTVHSRGHGVFFVTSGVQPIDRTLPRRNQETGSMGSRKGNLWKSVSRV